MTMTQLIEAARCSGWLLAAALGLGWGVHAWRSNRDSCSDNVKGRVSQPEPISLDLHDTLLQGFQGLALRFQAIADGLAEGSETRQAIESVLVRVDKVLADGRDRVAELRPSPPPPGSLAQSLAAMGRELSENRTSRFEIEIEGEPRELKHSTHEAMYFIGGQALFNAFEHAHAAKVCVLLSFRAAAMTLTVRDDGRGLPFEFRRVVTDLRRQSRWSLGAMTERAIRAGGRLRVRSGPGAGTEVVVRVPAAKAYTVPVPVACRFGWARSFRPGRKR